MNATITFYVVDLCAPGGKELHKLIKDEMKAVGIDRMECYTPVNRSGQVEISKKISELRNEDVRNGMSEPYHINLELEHVFSNQWNEESYGRIFDWYEYTYENKNIFAGYFLDFYPCVLDKRCVKKCGYCGELKTEENKDEWNGDYHLSCSIEYLEESNLFLTKATRIWEDKKTIHKNDKIPTFVSKNFWERKRDFISGAFEKAAKDMYGSAKREYESALMKSRILLRLSAICKNVAKEHHIFIKPQEIIIYMHKIPYEVNLRWMRSDKKLTKEEIQAITETFVRHPEFNKENHYFEFSPFICNAPVVVKFNGDE